MINNLRRCIFNQKSFSKNELVRIVYDKKTNTFLVNSQQPGRGVYVKKDITNPNIIKEKRLLHKSFRKNIDLEVYDQLINFLKEGTNE